MISYGKALLGIALSCLIGETLAQPELILVRNDKVKYTLYPGDDIRLKTKSRKRPKSGTISGIYRDLITLTNRDTIYVTHIRSIDVRNLPAQGFHVKSAGRKLMLAGTLLFIADRASASNEGGDGTGVTVASAALFGTGLFMQIINNDYFKVGRRNRIAVRGVRWR